VERGLSQPAATSNVKEAFYSAKTVK